jgi:hypothetical protein
MLITLVDVISCENPLCREFAKPVFSNSHGVRSYYCHVCGKVSYPRAVDAGLAASPQQFEAYMRRLVAPSVPAGRG